MPSLKSIKCPLPLVIRSRGLRKVCSKGVKSWQRAEMKPKDVLCEFGDHGEDHHVLLKASSVGRRKRS